jgi:hypothetical protein
MHFASVDANPLLIRVCLAANMADGSNAVAGDGQPLALSLLTSSTNVRIPALKALLPRLEDPSKLDSCRSAPRIHPSSLTP